MSKRAGASAAAAEILSGSVMHSRLRPVAHRFAYRVFFLRLRLSALDASGNALFSINRFNLASFHFRDHGARDGTHPLVWIRALLAREGVTGLEDGEVWLQCFPRVLGYVFNPVSFWFCHDRGGRLRAVLAEVCNTFGERHAYLLAHPDARPIEDADTLDARKAFHVSPFLAVAGSYAFRFFHTGGVRVSRIDYRDESGPLLLTSITGRAATLNASRLALAFAAHPFMTLGVMLRIHWQALRLWAKRVPVFAKPSPPSRKLTR